jgi:hypothetical protein
MRASFDQRIAASAQDAQAAFLDPDFYDSLGELPGISAPEVRSWSRPSPGRARIVLGYRFAGTLSGPARRLLDPRKLTWAQVTEVDLASKRTQVEMVPDNYSGLFSFSGWYELRDEGEGHSSQHFEGDLRVHLPLLGPLAERAIATGIRQNLAATAQLVERYVAGQAKGAAAKNAVDGPAAGSGGGPGAEDLGG